MRSSLEKLKNEVSYKKSLSLECLRDKENEFRAIFYVLNRPETSHQFAGKKSAGTGSLLEKIATEILRVKQDHEGKDSCEVNLPANFPLSLNISLRCSTALQRFF